MATGLLFLHPSFPTSPLTAAPRQRHRPLLSPPLRPGTPVKDFKGLVGCQPTVWSSAFEGRRRVLTSAMAGAELFPVSQVVYDVGMSGFASLVALSLLRFWEEVAKRGFFDQKVNRKMVHISVGMVFMLMWPIFSTGIQAPFLAALAPGINIIRMLLIGLGIYKNEAVVKSMSRDGDYREILKGPLYYASTITLATIMFWRTSPIGVSAICNLCAGDGFADLIGRRFGKEKLPYNKNKSFAGSIAMAASGFIASLMYMHYLSSFGFIEKSWDLVLGFLLASISAAVVESLPISTDLDDNLTVPLTSILVGVLVF